MPASQFNAQLQLRPEPADSPCLVQVATQHVHSVSQPMQQHGDLVVQDVEDDMLDTSTSQQYAPSQASAHTHLDGSHSQQASESVQFEQRQIPHSEVSTNEGYLLFTAQSIFPFKSACVSC